jgi:hypothetical protein
VKEKGRAGRHTIGVLTVLIVTTSVFFESEQALARPHVHSVPCENPLDAQHCEEINHGSVTVGAGREQEGESPRRDDRPASSKQGVDGLVASCVDARAEALAQGVAVPPRIEALCGGLPAVTADLVLRAFRELPLYRGGINTDPKGWTLVNLETYFWCGDASGRSCAVLGEAEQTVTLLGRQVRVRPRIISYRWSFGDGVEQTVVGGTGRAGHVYRRQGTPAVRVTLTWTADFAVAGQPFQPIVGTTTTTSPPLAFPVRQARPVLVGGDRWGDDRWGGD